MRRWLAGFIVGAACGVIAVTVVAVEAAVAWRKDWALVRDEPS